MLVCVGSENRSKLKGVERAYKLFVRELQVVGLKISSEVTPQPLDLETVFRGALIRARKSLELTSSAEHGVGIEAGLFNLHGTWFDVHVAVIADRCGLITYGLSPAFEVPSRFVKELLGGGANELEMLVDNYFKTKSIGEYGGFIKLLTNGHVLRDDLVFYSVLMALVPRVNKDLYST